MSEASSNLIPKRYEVVEGDIGRRIESTETSSGPLVLGKRLRVEEVRNGKRIDRANEIFPRSCRVASRVQKEPGSEACESP